MNRSPDMEQAVRAAARMPDLPHHRPGERFNIQCSAVCDWLVDQAEVKQWVFNIFRKHGAIQFDAATGRWRGAAWKPN
jgi:hypothetical protein